MTSAPIWTGEPDYSVPVPFRYRDVWPGEGWRPGSLDHFWNTPLPDTVILHPYSAGIVTATVDDFTGGAGLDPLDPADAAHPVYFANEADPLYMLKDDGTYGGTWPYDGMMFSIPADAIPVEGRMIVVQPDGTALELYDCILDDEALTATCSWGGFTGNFADGYTVGTNGEEVEGNVVSETVDLYSSNSLIAYGGISSNTPAMFGQIWPHEWYGDAEIEHKLCLVVSCSGRSRSGATNFMWPASQGSEQCDEEEPPRSMVNRTMNGQIWRLGYTADEIDLLAVPDETKKILRCLRRFGAVVTDAGGPGFAIRGCVASESWTAFGYDDPWTGAPFDLGGWDPYKWEVLNNPERTEWRGS